MKKIFLSLLVIINYNISFGQAGTVVRINSIINITECKPNGTVTDNPAIQTDPGSLVKIYTQNDSITVFYFLFWGKKKGDSVLINNKTKFDRYNISNPENKDKIYVDPGQTGIKYFCVSTSLFKAHTSEIESRFSVGFLTLPFKLRLKDFDFSSNVQLGVGLARKLGNTNGYIVGSIGLSTVNLDSANAKNIKTNADAVKDVAAFSFSLGYMYKFNNAQGIIALGWDCLSKYNQNKYGWNNNGKAWLGIGLGFSIFNKDKDGSKNNN